MSSKAKFAPERNGHSSTDAPKIALQVLADGKRKARIIDVDLAERSTLRALMSDVENTRGYALRFLQPEFFQNAEYRVIAEAVWECNTKLGRCDAETVEAFLLDQHEIQAGVVLNALILPTPEPSRDEFHDAAHTVQNWKLAASTCSRFILHSLTALAARPPRLYLIDGVLYADGTSLITAKEATFKTFFSLDQALCIATGTAWHGRKVKQGAVVYVAAEGAAGIVKRVRAWCIEHGCEFPDNFHIVDEPVQIADATVLAQFIEAVASVSPVLIVLDTLARCAVGLDENSAKDMGEFVEALRLLAARTDAHVQTLHHNNKAGEYRGSSALVAAVDTRLCLERPEFGDYVTLRCEKMKDDEAAPPMVFEKQVVYIDDYASESSLVFVLTNQSVSTGRSLTNAEDKVLAELAGTFGDEGATVAEWKRSCLGVGVAERTFHLAKKHLAKLQLVQCTDEGKRGAKWTPTPTGDAMAPDDESAVGASHCKNGVVAPLHHDPSARVQGCNTPLGVAPLHLCSEGADSQTYIGASPELQAHRDLILSANPPAQCGGCKKPLTVAEASALTWSGDTPRIECKDCNVLLTG